jgi:hypothetical protein
MTLQAISHYLPANLPGSTNKPKGQLDDFSALLEAQPPVAPSLSPGLTAASVETTQSVSDSTQSSLSSAKPKEKSPTELFQDYMHKTPEQRWHEAWLAQHNLTEEQFNALPPEEKLKLEAQMRDDLKTQVKQSTEKALKQHGAPAYL